MIPVIPSISGSSPRTWGTLPEGVESIDVVRFIPTYMGNAYDRVGHDLHGTVHPHVHGERQRLSPGCKRCCGSSPRTWGTPPIIVLFVGCYRFIPTYMGNARVKRRIRRYHAVHPHVHGERYGLAHGVDADYGSSPRTWGTHVPVHPDVGSLRFIPTYMGNAISGAMPTASNAVHPHVHGERRPAPGRSRPAAGSSPRTWGTRRLRKLLEPAYRFIPTYMGNAGGQKRVLFSGSVHPHVHGERRCCVYDAWHLYGSSPRTWGTHSSGVSAWFSVRFIPTYMGNAADGTVSVPLIAVHPHVHGEREIDVQAGE